MQFFGNIIRPHELDSILVANESNEGLPVGKLTSYDPAMVIRLFRIWCARIDKLVKMDREVNGTSWKGHLANYWRGFTYEEYFDLFNKNISEEKGEFAFYPVFSQLNRDKGGINYEKQRNRFTVKYEYDEEDYIRVLCDNGFEPILQFFFNKEHQQTVHLPKPMMDAHMYLFGPTRSGKSNLLRHLIYQILSRLQDHSMIVLDAHGQLAKQVYRSKLFQDFSRVVYFSANLQNGYTPSINLFEIPSKDRNTLIHASDNILSVFNTIFRGDDKLTIPQKTMLQKCVNYVLRKPNASMDVLMDLLNANSETVEDACGYDAAYFSERFQKGRKDAVREALLSKLEMIYENEGMGLLIKGRGTISLEQIINTPGKVVIFDLSGLAKGFSRVAFGKMLLAYIENIAVKRDAEDSSLVPCYLVIDECQTFVSETYGDLLTEMSKFGIRMILASQFVNQLGDQVEDVQRNTAIKIGSGHYAEDFHGMMKIPKRFQSDRQTEAGKVDLKPYEFFVDVRFRNLVKIKSPFFLTGKNYELSSEELAKLQQYQLEHYYRAIGEEEKIEVEAPHLQTDPIPPFQLYLGEDDSAIDK